MKAVFTHIRRYDWFLMGAVFVLAGLGLLTLFSVSSASAAPFFARQLTWVAIGIALLVLASFIDFRMFRTQGVLIFFLYLFGVALLVILLLKNAAVRGVEGWLQVGGFTVQPVEAVKLILIILLAKFFSKRHIEIYRLRHLVVSGLYMALPAFLVIAQPDLGSAIVLVAIWFSIVLFSGMKLRHLALLFILGAIVSGILWNFVLEPYQKSRITSFLNPQADPKGAGYQAIQSIIAVGSGRMWGKGLGYGSQSHLNFLPEAETDFIFAAYAEEWGFVGVLVMLGLYFLVLWRIIVIGMRASDNFSRLYTLGFAALIFMQSFIHIGINMGLLPITGITLPFVSYGGSSLVTLLAGIGIVQNIKMNARRAVDVHAWRGGE